ncbi:MAG TPA: hypothetical protein PLZ77_09935, partial [Lachnospiraceae bacterium]|nr:hypothetical protein [Lachnospiraceae bacterium]
LDYFVSTGKYSILRSMRSPQEKASLEAVLKVIQEKWLTALTDFVRYRNDTLTGMGNSLKARMLTLKEYRNAIVHNGGMMIDRETRDESKSGLDGIYSFAGTVFISLKGEETLSKLVNDATDLLCEIQ